MGLGLSGFRALGLNGFGGLGFRAYRVNTL